MAGRLRLPLRPRDEARMTLIEHLGELRSRLIKVGIVFVVGAVIGWIFRKQVFELLLEPAGGRLEELAVTAVAEQLVTDMKMALYVGFVLTVPVLLYQMWAFVAPAVGEMGRVQTYIIIGLASSLFLAGIVFGYYFVLPVGMQFLLNWDLERFTLIITPTFYLAFVTRFLLACGIVFELPAATYVAAKLGLVDAPLLKKYRRHAIVANTVLAAALTPSPDPFSMIMLAIPMVALYEVSIIIARAVNPVSEVAVHQLDHHDEEEIEPYDDPRDDSQNGDEPPRDRDL